MRDRDADPTAALAMVRVIIREWEATDREPPAAVLAYLVDKLDSWLLQGAYLPSQWTGPEGAGWEGWNRFTAAEITDPDQALSEVRNLVRRIQSGQPDDADRLFALVAGLDQVATDEQSIPRPWMTTTG